MSIVTQPQINAWTAEHMAIAADHWLLHLVTITTTRNIAANILQPAVYYDTKKSKLEICGKAQREAT